MREIRIGRMRLIQVMALAIVLSVAMTGGCTRKVAQDPTKPASPALDQISVQLARVREGVDAVKSVKRALLADKKISKETSHSLSLKLKQVTDIASEINDQADQYDTLGVAERAGLAPKLKALKDARANLTAAGDLPKSSVLDKAFAILDVALGELSKLIGGF